MPPFNPSGHRATGRRPEWWPANEPWPPHNARWRGGRGRFFARMGCLASLIAFVMLMVFVMIVILAANALGLLQISGSLGWIIPLGGVTLLLGFVALGLAGRGLRRMSLPLGDLIEASERLAGGDYTARVTEKGPQEVRSLVRTFNNMAERLQISENQRRNFMADVTHELRTPLTVIQGNLEGMLDGVYPADEPHIRSILEETELLGRLVDDLRTLALAEGGALMLRIEPTDLAALIGETVTSFQAQAAVKGISLQDDLAQDAPMLDLDPERMRQVLSNLISNALRYTLEGGSVWLRYSIQPAPAGQAAQIDIQDTGRGISPGELPHVFDRFYKTNDSSGMGLGLSIARTLVEAHGGNIRVESETGQGAHFMIRLPIEAKPAGSDDHR